LFEYLRRQTDLNLCAEKAIADSPKTVADYKAGNICAALTVLRTQIKRQYKGTVNPTSIDRVLEKLLA
jgi:Asp-tRNA(Asn)/Glu-tRNA(Gln) amidotransferase B subunit